MRTKILKLIAVLSMVLLAFNGCKKDEGEEPNPQPNVNENVSVRGYEHTSATDTIQMKPNVIYVKNDINNNFLSQDLENEKITFKNNKEQDIIKVGDVIFSNPTDKNPDGYALKIKDKKKEGDNIIYSYEYASFQDVFEQLNIKAELEPDLSEKGITIYDIFDDDDTEESRTSRKKKDSSGLALVGEIIGFDSKKFKKVSFEKNKAVLEYIAGDADGDYKTTYDQVIITLELDFENSNSNIIIDKYHFRAYGYPKFGAKIKFSSNVEGWDTVNDKIKSYWKKKRKSIVDKKIKIAEFKLSSMTPTDLVFKPSIAMYIRMGLSGEAKLEIEFSYTDVVMHYNFQNYEDGNNDKFEVSLENKGRPNVALNASLEGTLKLGIGVGFFMRFPQFHYAKHQQSYIGVQAEGVLTGEAELKAALSTKEGFKCTDVTLTTKADFQAGIEGKLGIFRSKILDIDLKDIIKKITIKDPWSTDFNFCEETKNLPNFTLSTYSVTLELGEIKKVAIVGKGDDYTITSNNNEIATASEIKKGEIAIIAKNIGETSIEVKNNESNKKQVILVRVISKNRTTSKWTPLDRFAFYNYQETEHSYKILDHSNLPAGYKRTPYWEEYKSIGIGMNETYSDKKNVSIRMQIEKEGPKLYVCDFFGYYNKGYYAVFFKSTLYQSAMYWEWKEINGVFGLMIKSININTLNYSNISDIQSLDWNNATERFFPATGFKHRNNNVVGKGSAVILHAMIYDNSKVGWVGTWYSKKITDEDKKLIENLHYSDIEKMPYRGISYY